MASRKAATAEVEVVEPGGEMILRPTMNMEMLMQRAIEHNASVETVERLAALAESMRDKWADREYKLALAEFQDKVPTIGRTKGVKEKGGGSVRYYYAPYEEIVKTIAPLCNQLGFSHSEDTSVEPMTPEEIKVFGKGMGWLVCVCSVHHREGCTKTSTFKVPIGSEFMTMQQQMGAASTFAKRYALLNAFGLATGGEDTDANFRNAKPVGGGGADHRYKADPEPQSRSEQADEPKRSTKRPPGYEDVVRAKDAASKVGESTIKTILASMKRAKITEQHFKEVFGFPVQDVAKASLNRVVDYIQKEGA